MKYLLLLLLSGCGLTKNLDKMSSGMDSVKNNMSAMASDLGKTSKALGGLNSGIKAISLNMMLDPANTKYVSPSSTTPSASMVAGAKGFASSATTEDIVGVVYLFLTEINQSQPDTVSKDTKKSTDKDKWVKLTAIELISTFMTQEKLEEIIKTEIDSQYVESVYAILTFRYIFITSYILDNGVLNSTITTIGGFKAAFEFISNIDFIESLKFKDKCEVKLVGFFQSDLNQTVSIPKDLISKDYFKKLKEKFEKDLDKKYVGTEDYLSLKTKIEQKLK